MISSVIRPQPPPPSRPLPPSTSTAAATVGARDCRTLCAKSLLCVRNPEATLNVPTLDKPRLLCVYSPFPNLPLMSSALRPIYSQGDISECIFNNHPLVMGGRGDVCERDAHLDLFACLFARSLFFFLPFLPPHPSFLPSLHPFQRPHCVRSLSSISPDYAATHAT